MTPRSSAVVCFAVAFAGAVAWACGPEFPNQLLSDRAATLKAAPQNSFSFEAARLLPATDKLVLNEVDPYDYSSDEKKKPGDSSLTDAQAAAVLHLREADSGAAAYQAGVGLPEDLRWYVAGAVDYARALTDACPSDDGTRVRSQCDGYDEDALGQAEANFQKVLDLPPETAQLRSVWAAYMLGEIHALRAASDPGTPAFLKERDAAGKAFELARQRAVAGASDTQGLAVASFGEQAGLYLYAGATECGWDQLSTGADCGNQLTPADLKHAIALYAAQAGHGSHSGMLSLATIAGAVLATPDRAAAMLDGPLSQRLLVTYAISNSPRVAEDGKVSEVLAHLVSAIEKAGLDQVSGADRLAVLAYQAGRYDLAGQLAAKDSSALTCWVRAKLAIQKGDLAGAAQAYADAAKAFPAADDVKANLEPKNAQLIIGEQGVLALARGEYLEAITHLFAAASSVGGDGNIFYEQSESYGPGYASDVAYIAERVLTVDEFKGFVDAHVPVVPIKPTVEGSFNLMPVNDRLRWVLARRLMRAGRYEEAQVYFPPRDVKEPGYVDLKARAAEYAQDLHEAEHAWTSIGQAEARYAAATIARFDGMELFGYEQGPDYTDNGGSYPGGTGHPRKTLTGPYVTAAELQRYDSSAANPTLRFHYRYLAADQASQAANQLPARSQAFAAVLCNATRWMFDGPGDSNWYFDEVNGETDAAKQPDVPTEREKRAAGFYQRYVKEGAYVSWASNFGQACPKPDFAAARTFQQRQWLASARHTLHQHWLVGLAGVVIVAGAGVYIARRRRAAV